MNGVQRGKKGPRRWVSYLLVFDTECLHIPTPCTLYDVTGHQNYVCILRQEHATLIYTLEAARRLLFFSCSLRIRSSPGLVCLQPLNCPTLPYILTGRLSMGWKCGANKLLRCAFPTLYNSMYDDNSVASGKPPPLSHCLNRLSKKIDAGQLEYFFDWAGRNPW